MVFPLPRGAWLARGLQQQERAAVETRKVTLFLDGCLGFVRAPFWHTVKIMPLESED